MRLNNAARLLACIVLYGAGIEKGNESWLKCSPNHLVRRIPCQEVVQTAINIRERMGHCHKHSFICGPSQAAASLLVLQPSRGPWSQNMPKTWKTAKNAGLPNADQEALHCRWRAPANLTAHSRERKPSPPNSKINRRATTAKKKAATPKTSNNFHNAPPGPGHPDPQLRRCGS